MFLLITVLFTAAVPTYAAAPDYKTPAKPVKVFVEGQEKSLALPILENKGRTLYPFKQLMQLLGAEVGWDEVKKEASATKDGTTVAFVIGKDSYSVNGETKKMETAAVVDKASSSTYIPIRYAAEALGYAVDWLMCGESNELWVSKEYKESNNYKIIIDGKTIEFTEDMLPLGHGPLYVPLDYTVKWMGGKTNYDTKTKLITVQKGSIVFKVKVGSGNIIIGNKTWRDDYSELITKNGTVYITAMSLAFGFDKDYTADHDKEIIIIEDKKTKYVKVYLDDKEITFPDNIRPFVADGEPNMPVLLPVEYITGYLGGEAKWDSKSNTVNITYKGHTIVQKDDKKAHAYVDGKEVSTFNRLIIKDGVAYIGALDYSSLVFQWTGLKDFNAVRDSRDHHVVICTKDYFVRIYGGEMQW